MARLTYLAIASLDGYVEDDQGKFDWAAPDEEVHAFVNDLARPWGTHLYGRRMYETMVWWETGDHAAVYRDYAEIWRAAEKVVYSRTLQTVSSNRTRIEREFDAAAIRRLKESSRSTCRSAGPSSPGRQSPRGWSTSAISSSRRSWWAVASAPYPPASMPSSSCVTSAAFAAASSIFITV